MATNIIKDDVGTILELTIKDQDNAIVNISGATILKIKLRKPSGSLLDKTAVLSTNGTDGKLRYTTIAGDLDQSGEWRMQAYIEIGATTKFYTSKTTFDVLDHL